MVKPKLSSDRYHTVIITEAKPRQRLPVGHVLSNSYSCPNQIPPDDRQRYIRQRTHEEASFGKGNEPNLC